MKNKKTAQWQKELEQVRLYFENYKFVADICKKDLKYIENMFIKRAELQKKLGMNKTIKSKRKNKNEK